MPPPTHQLVAGPVAGHSNSATCETPLHARRCAELWPSVQAVLLCSLRAGPKTALCPLLLLWGGAANAAHVAQSPRLPQAGMSTCPFHLPLPGGPAGAPQPSQPGGPVGAPQTGSPMSGRARRRASSVSTGRARRRASAGSPMATRGKQEAEGRERGGRAAAAEQEGGGGARSPKPAKLCPAEFS
eukprot:769973-Alexandrium_andersonii.AAC.1